jgi:uncharacterized protein (TIGR03083 family)
MASTGNWPIIHAERAALAADLEALDGAGWETPSWCAGWTVRDVVAHMTGTAHVTPANFFPKMIGAGFSLKRMQAKDIATQRGSSSSDTLANFRRVLTSTKHPPGPNDTWLGETLVHAEDVRRPLGMSHDYAIDGAVRVADFYKGSNLIIGAKRRIAGLQLRATDADWSHGDGPEVSGPIMALVMAMTGRKGANDELSGDGVATLRGRP